MTSCLPVVGSLRTDDDTEHVQLLNLQVHFFNAALLKRFTHHLDLFSVLFVHMNSGCFRCVVLNYVVVCLCRSGNYVLNYLATRPKLAAFVTQALIQLYARITKLGWFDCQKDDYVFRNVIADVTRFLQVCVQSHGPQCVFVCVTVCHCR